MVWVAYWVFLFYAMHTTKPPGMSVAIRLGDKAIHTGVYFVLAGLGGWVALRRGRVRGARWVLSWWGIYAAYAVADELIQPLVGRYCQFTDWVADVIGVAAALLLVAWLARRRSPAGCSANGV